MSFWNSILKGMLNTGAVAAEGIIEGTEEELLRKVHEKNPEWHKTICQSFYPGLKLLKQITDETPSKLDDIGVNSMHDAIIASAAEFGAELPA